MGSNIADRWISIEVLRSTGRSVESWSTTSQISGVSPLDCHGGSSRWVPTYHEISLWYKNGIISRLSWWRLELFKESLVAYICASIGMRGSLVETALKKMWHLSSAHSALSFARFPDIFCFKKIFCFPFVPQISYSSLRCHICVIFKYQH